MPQQKVDSRGPMRYPGWMLVNVRVGADVLIPIFVAAFPDLRIKWRKKQPGFIPELICFQVFPFALHALSPADRANCSRFVPADQPLPQSRLSRVAGES